NVGVILRRQRPEKSSASPAFFQTNRVAGRQTGLTDARLHGFNVVRDPAGFPYDRFGVEDGVRGPGIVIARLADRARVENSALNQLERLVRLWNSPGDLALIVLVVDDLNVCMTDETQLRMKRFE